MKALICGERIVPREYQSSDRSNAGSIHPAMLSERGLTAALESLAERSPVPVELDADHRFVTWHPQTVEMGPSTDWQEEHIGPIQLDPRTTFVNVSCYLEPGGAVGDEVEIDDITIDYAH